MPAKFVSCAVAMIANPCPNDKVSSEEVFGPVCTVTAVDSLDDAIRLANGTRYGLQAGIFTASLDSALRAAQDAQKAQWDAASWGGGERRAEQLKDTLAELRVRADCYGALADMTFADVATWLGIEDAE